MRGSTSYYRRRWAKIVVHGIEPVPVEYVLNNRGAIADEGMFNRMRRRNIKSILNTQKPASNVRVDIESPTSSPPEQIDFSFDFDLNEEESFFDDKFSQDFVADIGDDVFYF